MRKLLKWLFTLPTPTPDERRAMRRLAAFFTACIFIAAVKALIAGKFFPAALFFLIAGYFTTLFYLHPPA